jgi:hypothetical protein
MAYAMVMDECNGKVSFVPKLNYQVNAVLSQLSCDVIFFYDVKIEKDKAT